MLADFFQRLACAAELGEGAGLGLVSEDDVYVAVYDVVQEGVVAFYDVVGGHIQGDDAAGLVRQLYSAADKVLVLNEIALDMEVVMACEILGFEVFGHEVQGGAEVDGEGAFCVASAHENHGPAAGMLALEEHGVDSVLLLVALEEEAELVVSDLADEAGGHAEDGGADNGVGRTAAGDVFDAQGLEGGPYLVARFHVYVLHAALGQMVCLQEAVVRQDGQDIREGVANSENRFHNKQRYGFF